MNNSFAAKGNLLSGGATKEIGQYASGFAAQNSNDYIGQLFQLAGLGGQAASGQANAVTGLAAPMAQAQYSSAIANQNSGNTILSLLAAGGGAAASAFGAPAPPPKTGGTTGGGGTVNMSPFLAAEG